MRLLVLVLALLPLSFAKSCGDITMCYECDSLLNSKGDQACSWCDSTSHCVPASGLECIFGTKISNKDECPQVIPKGYEYNETLSKKMLLVSFSSYGDDAQLCLHKNALDDVKVTKQITVSCDTSGDDTCSGFVGVSDVEKTIMVVFRGTMGNEQLFLEAEEMLFKHSVNVPGGGAVSKYFYDAYLTVWDGGMSAELERLKKLYPDYTLWVTGHSMGAALATVAANLIAANKVFPPERTKVMTYGEPRVGNEEFAIAHDKMLPFKYRVTHRQDMVTHVPPKGFLGYRHHRYEVWYNNDMNPGDEYKICLESEDGNCSDQNLFDLSWPDHTHYYGHYVDAHKVNGCQNMP